MITDGKKWHYIAVTNLSTLLQGNSSNHYGDFYCLNWFSSYTTKNNLKEHEEICNNHYSCHIEMPKSCGNNNSNNNNDIIEKPYTENKAKHEPSGWVIFTRCSFDKKENKLILLQRERLY